MEAEAVRLVDALGCARYRAQLAGQADFAEAHHALGQGLVPEAGRDRQHHRQIDRRLVQPHAADHVDIHVGRGQEQPAALFQNRQQQHHAVVVHARGGAARHAELGFRGERLHLGKQRAAALHHAGDAVAGGALRVPGQHSSGGVLHLHKAVVAHFKHADLIGRAVAVFCRAQAAERAGGLPLKVEHTVHHMLEDFGACERPFLVDVADDEDGHVFVLRVLHQAHRTFLDLRRAAGRGGQVAFVDRLDRVHDQDIGREQLGLADDLLHVGLREDVQVGRGDMQARRAQLDLAQGFLAGYIEHARGFAHLQQERGFADARLAADQHKRAVHRAAAQHAVELADAGVKPRLVPAFDIAQQGRAGRAALEAVRAARDGFGLHLELAHGVPCPT